MSAFRAEFIAARSMDFIGMIKECDEAGFPKVYFIIRLLIDLFCRYACNESVSVHSDQDIILKLIPLCYVMSLSCI